MIQSRAMDNLMRVYFAFPEVREALRGPEQDPNLGAALVVAGVPAGAAAVASASDPALPAAR